MAVQEDDNRDTMACIVNKANNYTTDFKIINLDQTITSVVGFYWNLGNRGCDIIEPKAGMLTLREIVNFFTDIDGRLCFGPYDNLKDISSYVVYNKEQKNYWTPIKHHNIDINVMYALVIVIIAMIMYKY